MSGFVHGLPEWEHLLYRWDSESQGALYFVVPTKNWNAYKHDGNDRTVLARGTSEEMHRLLKLVKEEDE